jgi:mRNA interferase RelE/StbE
MAYAVEILPSALRGINELDAVPRRRILKFLYERVARLNDPRSIGQALKGSDLSEYWKYRVGDYRVICKIQDDRLVVLVVRIGHRREVYR